MRFAHPLRYESVAQILAAGVGSEVERLQESTCWTLATALLRLGKCNDLLCLDSSYRWAVTHHTGYGYYYQHVHCLLCTADVVAIRRAGAKQFAEAQG